MWIVTHDLEQLISRLSHPYKNCLQVAFIVNLWREQTPFTSVEYSPFSLCLSTSGLEFDSKDQVLFALLISKVFLLQLISQIIGFLLWAAGFIYLLENQGDPFHHYENARPPGEFRYVDAIWFLLITASTVGYGDFFPVTDLGKIFGIFYLGRNSC